MITQEEIVEEWVVNFERILIYEESLEYFTYVHNKSNHDFFTAKLKSTKMERTRVEENLIVKKWYSLIGKNSHERPRLRWKYCIRKDFSNTREEEQGNRDWKMVAKKKILKIFLKTKWF